MNAEIALKLWGKTDRGNNARQDNYHPLLFHLFDVANCAAELWEKLPRRIKQRMADALNISMDQAGTVFVLLAGLHDLGKAYPKFQEQADQFLPSLKGAGFDFPDDIGKPPHNFVSVPEVMRLFEEAGFLPCSLSPEISRLFAYSLGAHHGVFPQSADLSAITDRTLGVNLAWQEARDWMADQLKISIPLFETAFNADISTSVSDKSFAPLLAALISLADWFGSSKYFEMDGAQNIESYREISCRSAKEALTKSGWEAPSASPKEAGFAELFAYLKKENDTRPIEPNPLQAKTGELLKGVQAPTLWMIEEEMGAGKTETAFSIFDDCRVKGLAHGVYIAMPTQATSNAMFTRLGDFLKYRNPNEKINLILAHSHATLDQEYLDRMKIADSFTGSIFNEVTGEEEGTLLVRSWFTQSKQTLLAHYGVGTIDQALMGVLQTRHWFVRLFGLAGKVVIFDEVHAYDAYMNSLLSRLILWLAELDCTVVLLSATLPKKTRLELADAYAKGSRAALMEPGNLVSYPRITLVKKGEPDLASAVTLVKEPKPTPKTVALLHRPNTPDAVKTALLEAIPGDGCAIVICNTVVGAQKMYEALSGDLKSEGWQCSLFHARTPFKWRKEREDEVLKAFGKQSGEDGKIPRGKTLLVATQVVEQSLDLDADFMASEIAPADLILQRMGRLYRHNRKRNTGAATFALLYDTNVETGLPVFGNSEYVYAPYNLLRSWLALKDKTEIVLPDDIEPLVTAVYDAPEPTYLPEELTNLLAEKLDILKKERYEQRIHANSVSVFLQEEDATFTDWISSLKPTLLDEEDPNIHKTLLARTRDGEPSITIVVCGTDEYGKQLAPDPAGYIHPTNAKKMMGFSLSLSNKSIYHKLKSDLPPANWKQNSHLKYCRCVNFINGVAIVANLKLTLTQEKGLVIEKDDE